MRPRLWARVSHVMADEKGSSGDRQSASELPHTAREHTTSPARSFWCVSVEPRSVNRGAPRRAVGRVSVTSHIASTVGSSLSMSVARAIMTLLSSLTLSNNSIQQRALVQCLEAGVPQQRDREGHESRL